MKKLLLILVLCPIVLGSFGQSYSQKWSDVNYANDGKTFHNLDIYLPNGTKTSYPVVIHFFGSAWMSDNGKTLNSLGTALLNAGFAVVTPNYRSSSDAKFPAQSQDLKAAIRFVRGNCDKYKLDTTFIGVTGESSGGHSAAFCGTTNFVKQKTINGITFDLEGSLGQFTNFGSNVHAACDWFGPTNFLVMDSCFTATKITSGFGKTDDASSPASQLVGGAIQNNKDKCALANPITYVDPTDPPFLIVHGDADNIVPCCQSALLFNALQAARVQSEYILAPGGGHMDAKTETTANLAKMVSFFTDVKSKITGTNSPEGNSFSVVANSVSGILTLKGITGDSYNYELYEVSGKLVLQNSLRNSNQIDISALNKGMYFIKIQAANEPMYTSRFVK